MANEKNWTPACDETGNYVMEGNCHIASVNEQSDLALICAAPRLCEALEALARTHRGSAGWKASNLGKMVEGALETARRCLQHDPVPGEPTHLMPLPAPPVESEEK